MTHSITLSSLYILVPIGHHGILPYSWLCTTSSIIIWIYIVQEELLLQVGLEMVMGNYNVM